MNSKNTEDFTEKQHDSRLKKLLVPILALVFLLTMVAWLAGFFNAKVAPQIKTSIATASNDNGYIVTRLKSEDLEGVAASITAKQATIISSRILARIDDIKVRSGDEVKQGDILISLEQNNLSSQAIEANEQVKAMQARHKEAQQNFQRAKELYKKKLVSEFELDKSKADYQSISAELTAAKQSLEQAKTTLSYATLRAPINGKVVERFAEPGNTAQPGTKLLSLYNPLSLRVEAQVREALALTLTQGQKIQIELPAKKMTLNGLIEEIVPAANIGSRTFLIKVSIDYSENLLPGMYARLLIPAGISNKLYIPQELVSRVGQLTFVWLDVNGKAERRFVRIGKTNKKGLVVIISGLQQGDKVRTSYNQLN